MNKIDIVLKNEENLSHVDKEIRCNYCKKNYYCTGADMCTVIKHLCMMEPKTVKTLDTDSAKLQIPAYNQFAFRRLDKQIQIVIREHTR